MKANRRMSILIAVTLLAAFALLETGSRLPYLYTGSAGIKRVTVGVLLFGGFLYWGFVHRWADGRTGLDYAAGRDSNRRGRVAIKGVLSAVAMCSALAVISLSLSAWAAKLTPGRAFAGDYLVAGKVARGSTMVRIDLTDEHSGEAHAQLWKYAFSPPLKVGSRVCVLGKSWLFGVTISSVKRSACADSGQLLRF